MRILSILKSCVQKRPAEVGRNCVIDPTAVFPHHSRITLGDYVRIGPQCVLNGQGGLTVGDGAILAPRVTILTSTHQYQQADYLPYWGNDECRPVVVGRGVWIGWGAMIVPGVKVEDGAVIAMGSVVTQDIGKGLVVGGNPAREINRRPDGVVDRLVEQHAYYLKWKLNASR